MIVCKGWQSRKYNILFLCDGVAPIGAQNMSSVAAVAIFICHWFALLFANRCWSAEKKHSSRDSSQQWYTTIRVTHTCTANCRRYTSKYSFVQAHLNKTETDLCLNSNWRSVDFFCASAAPCWISLSLEKVFSLRSKQQKWFTFQGRTRKCGTRTKAWPSMALAHININAILILTDFWVKGESNEWIFLFILVHFIMQG